MCNKERDGKIIITVNDDLLSIISMAYSLNYFITHSLIKGQYRHDQQGMESEC